MNNVLDKLGKITAWFIVAVIVLPGMLVYDILTVWFGFPVLFTKDES